MKLWKQLIGLFFLLVVVDGALRKWVLPGLASPLYVLKDVVLWGGYLSYASQRDPFQLPRPLRSTWVPLLLAAYISMVLLQAVNLQQPSLIVSAVGLKAHLAYLPLVVLLPALIAQVTEEQMMRFLWGYTVFLFLPIVALCIYQFFQPPSAWVNQYVRDMATIATVEDHPRITGTFSYIGSLTPYLRFSAFLSTSVLLAGLKWERRSLTVLGVIMLLGTALILPMPGSRGPIVLVLGSVTALFLVMRLRGYRLRLACGTLLLAIVVVQVFGGSGLLEGWDVLLERTVQVGGEEAEARTVDLLLAPITGIEKAGLFGYGVGTNHQAAPALVARTWDGFLGIDNGALRLITEVGMVGWLIVMAMKTSLLYVAFRTVRQSQTPVELIVGATGFCLLLNQLILPVVFNVVASAIYWGSAGAVLGIWSLQEVRRKRYQTKSRTSPA